MFIVPTISSTQVQDLLDDLPTDEKGMFHFTGYLDSVFEENKNKIVKKRDSPGTKNSKKKKQSPKNKRAK